MVLASYNADQGIITLAENFDIKVIQNISDDLKWHQRRTVN
jgi:hypothetical protein